MPNSFLQQALNSKLTTNGSLAYSTSGSFILDIFALGGSNPIDEELMINALKEDFILALKVIFYIRDIRQGQGRRDILTEFNKLIIQLDTEVLSYIIPFYPIIGSWKDVFKVMELTRKLDTTIVNMVKLAIDNDFDRGLVTKWLPRKGEISSRIKSHLGVTNKEYRKQILSLSSTVEQQICAKDFKNIDYSKVPSLAMLKYVSTFYKFDEERYSEFIELVKQGKAKINASVLYPHEIVSKIRNSNYKEIDSFNALWDKLPNYMENNPVSVFPIIDVSGSMSKRVRGEVSALDIAIGLGLYVAERNFGEWIDTWCTFSMNPSFEKLKGNSLSEKISNLDYDNWGMNTDINKVFEMMVNFDCDPKDFPKVILIVSDMEFDGCVKYTNNDYIKKLFRDKGLDIPTIVFWNVYTSTSNLPVTKDETGSILVSGFSPNILKEILSLEILDFSPLEFMLKTLGTKYDYLNEIFKGK